MAPCNGTTSTAPSNRTTSTPSKLVVTRLAHYNGTLQWHHPLPPPAHYNGTLQWHPAMAPRPLPQSWSSPSPPPHHSTLQWHPAMAPSNGTTSTAPCNGTLVPRPIRQSGSSPPPLLEVRTPIAIAIWGKNAQGSRVSSAHTVASSRHQGAGPVWKNGQVEGMTLWIQIWIIYIYMYIHYIWMFPKIVVPPNHPF